MPTQKTCRCLWSGILRVCLSVLLLGCQLLDLHISATTHTDIILRARGLGIPTRVIHNASIMNAVGACGLQLYNFGQTVSLVYFSETWKPDSFYDRVKENSNLGMHTLILLDIKVKEQSEENLARLISPFSPRMCHLMLITGVERFMSRHATCQSQQQCPK
jgi:diphthine synthase